MKHQKLARLFALALPLLGTLASAHAQDYSYNDGVYGNGGVYNNNDDVYGNRNGRGNGRGNGRFDNNSTRLRGTVERIYSSRSFDLRTQDGQIVRVKTDSDLNLQVGATTTVRGELRGKTFFAERVNRRNGGNYNGGYQNGQQSVVLRGEVIEVESRRALRVRDEDDGRVLRVQLQSNLNPRISRGDLVSVRGTFDGTILRADNGQVQLLSDDNRIDGNGNYGNGNYGNGNYGNGNNGTGYGNDNYGTNNGVYGRSVSFPATVRVVRRGEVEVRGDNGRTYIVRLVNNFRLNVRVGDRVRVQGISRNGFIEATQLNRTY